MGKPIVNECVARQIADELRAIAGAEERARDALEELIERCGNLRIIAGAIPKNGYSGNWSREWLLSHGFQPEKLRRLASIRGGVTASNLRLLKITESAVGRKSTKRSRPRSKSASYYLLRALAEIEKLPEGERAKLECYRERMGEVLRPPERRTNENALGGIY